MLFEDCDCGKVVVDRGRLGVGVDLDGGEYGVRVWEVEMGYDIWLRGGLALYDGRLSVTVGVWMFGSVGVPVREEIEEVESLPEGVAGTLE